MNICLFGSERKKFEFPIVQDHSITQPFHLKQSKHQVTHLIQINSILFFSNYKKFTNYKDILRKNRFEKSTHCMTIFGDMRRSKKNNNFKLVESQAGEL